jgi:hypothetical protein
VQYGRTRPDAVDAVIVDAETFQEIRVLPAIGTPFVDGFLGNRVGCSRSARYMAVGQDDGTIVIVESETGARVKTLETGGTPVAFITVHPDNETMIAGTADGRILRLKDPWPAPTSSVHDDVALTRDHLRTADEVLWYLLDGRCVGVGAEYTPQNPRQLHVVVARYGATVRTRLILDGGMQ